MSVITVLENGNITIDNAELLGGTFRNFDGHPDSFSPSGYNKGTFCVQLNDEQAEMLSGQGWNVKDFTYSGDDTTAPSTVHYLKVSYPITKDPNAKDRFPRNVYLVSNTKQVPLSSATVANLTYNSYDEIDIEIRPYDYDVNGHTGRSAYLNSGFFKIREIPFADRFSDIPKAI